MAANQNDPNAQKLFDLVRDIRVCMMTTEESDGSLHSRPMYSMEADERGSLWFFTKLQSPKVAEISKDRQVNLAYADPDNGDNARELWLMHAACLAIIERSALVTTAFTVLGKQVMHVRRNYRDRVDTEDGTPPSVKQLLQPSVLSDDDEPPYWANWTADFDYVYVLFTGAEYSNPDPSRLAPVYAGNRFMLYKIAVPVADADDLQSEPPALQRFARFHVRRVALGSLQRARAAAAQDAPSVDP